MELSARAEKKFLENVSSILKSSPEPGGYPEEEFLALAAEVENQESRMDFSCKLLMYGSLFLRLVASLKMAPGIFRATKMC